MARFEAALARASVASGFVPETAAKAIADAASKATFDAAALARESKQSGTLAVPFVKALTTQVGADGARYVHFGATSQDVVDTAIVLCLGEACQRVISLCRQLGDAAAALAKRHAKAPMVARTLLQPAVPVPFGWKAAVWLSTLARSHGAFRQAAAEARTLQFGGAGGTLSAYGAHGEAIAAALAKELGLAGCAITWHSARDRFARLGSEAAMLAGAAGKIARDVSLMMQPEVGEAFEPAAPGRGGSSAMPHKRNPVGSLAALEAAQRAPALAATLLSQLAPEHERGIGQWQSQWFTLKDLLCSTAGALASMAEVLEGLTIDADAMHANLERSRGLVYSEAVSVYLTRALGKQAAHTLTERLCEKALREGKHLKEVVAADADARKAGSEQEIAALFLPENHFGAAQAMIGRAIDEWRSTCE
jgi:3-carboxy-cis,cis-muconate cycloisomerase